MIVVMTLEELLAENERLRAENEALRRENAELRQSVKELQARLGILEREQKRQAGPFRRREETKVPPSARKKPGRKPGHPGAFRATPPDFDETVMVTLDKCPHCQGVVEPREMMTQFIEELPQIKPRVTRLVTWKGCCPQCGEVHSTHPLQTSRAKGAAGTQLGPRAQAFAVLLNKYYGLPLRKACQVLKQGFGLSLTAGGLSQLLDRVADKLQGKYDELLEQVRASDAVYADETSWYVGGPGHWLWVFTTPSSTIYRIANSRGHPIATQVLGSNFPGVLVTDCATCYDKFPGPKHKCIAHHLQAIERQRKQPGMKASRYLARWRRLWRDVLKLTHARAEFAAEDFAVRRAQIEARADRLLAEVPKQVGERKFRTRMTNARQHLFGCLHYDVDPTNNRAERAIRPAVVARKISCGNKTERGSRTTEILLSLITTAHQQARDFLTTLLPNLAPNPAPAG
jgi:transposase